MKKFWTKCNLRSRVEKRTTAVNCGFFTRKNGRFALPIMPLGKHKRVSQVCQPLCQIPNLFGSRQEVGRVDGGSCCVSNHVKVLSSKFFKRSKYLKKFKLKNYQFEHKLSDLCKQIQNELNEL